MHMLNTHFLPRAGMGSLCSDTFLQAGPLLQSAVNQMSAQRRTGEEGLSPLIHSCLIISLLFKAHFSSHIHSFSSEEIPLIRQG